MTSQRLMGNWRAGPAHALTQRWASQVVRLFIFTFWSFLKTFFLGFDRRAHHHVCLKNFFFFVFCTDNNNNVQDCNPRVSFHCLPHSSSTHNVFLVLPYPLSHSAKFITVCILEAALTILKLICQALNSCQRGSGPNQTSLTLSQARQE